MLVKTNEAMAVRVGRALVARLVRLGGYKKDLYRREGKGHHCCH